MLTFRTYLKIKISLKARYIGKVYSKNTSECQKQITNILKIKKPPLQTVFFNLPRAGLEPAQSLSPIGF